MKQIKTHKIKIEDMLGPLDFLIIDLEAAGLETELEHWYQVAFYFKKEFDNLTLFDSIQIVEVLDAQDNS